MKWHISFQSLADFKNIEYINELNQNIQNFSASIKHAQQINFALLKHVKCTLFFVATGRTTHSFPGSTNNMLFFLGMRFWLPSLLLLQLQPVSQLSLLYFHHEVTRRPQPLAHHNQAIEKKWGRKYYWNKHPIAIKVLLPWKITWIPGSNFIQVRWTKHKQQQKDKEHCLEISMVTSCNG